MTARKLELAPASQAKEKQLLVQLRTYFKQDPLKTITAKRITEYRAWRASQTSEVKAGETVRQVLCAGPATLNAELGILRRILKRAKLWARVADDIRPLKEPSSIGRALTEDDKQRLLKTAVMRPEWETAYLAAILCLNTTARGCELKGLQWTDVDLFGRILTIRKSKTAAGERTVPLTDVAASALARLWARAESFGLVESLRSRPRTHDYGIPRSRLLSKEAAGNRGNCSIWIQVSSHVGEASWYQRRSPHPPPSYCACPLGSTKYIRSNEVRGMTMVAKVTKMTVILCLVPICLTI